MGEYLLREGDFRYKPASRPGKTCLLLSQHSPQVLLGKDRGVGAFGVEKCDICGSVLRVTISLGLFGTLYLSSRVVNLDG